MSVRKMKVAEDAGNVDFAVDLATVTAIREIEGGCLAKIGGGPVWLELREEYGSFRYVLKDDGVSFRDYPMVNGSADVHDGDGKEPEKGGSSPTE